MASNFVAKMLQTYLPPALISLSFRNRMGYRYLNVRVNSVNDASIMCENFMKFGSVTPELTMLICERQVRHGEKARILAEYLQIYTGPIFGSFLPCETVKAIYMQIMDLYLIYQFVKVRCHGNQMMLQNCYQRRLIPLAFVAIVLETVLQYHGLAVHVNSAYDACIPLSLIHI